MLRFLPPCSGMQILPIVFPGCLFERFVASITGFLSSFTQDFLSFLKSHALVSRSLLAVTGRLAGLAALGGDAHGKSPVSGTSANVVVISAGLSGLVSARELLKKGKTVALLEAKSIISGRMANEKVAGDCVIDLGGQWGGKTH